MEVVIAVGYDSVSAFIEMFQTMLGTTPQTYFRGRQAPDTSRTREFRAGEPISTHLACCGRVTCGRGGTAHRPLGLEREQENLHTSHDPFAQMSDEELAQGLERMGVEPAVQ